ncbi:hypothetical protein DHD08_02260 [Arenibacter sp. H213]|nr:hypothetical protein [Arenibacter sp. H213]
MFGGCFNEIYNIQVYLNHNLVRYKGIVRKNISSELGEYNRKSRAANVEAATVFFR